MVRELGAHDGSSPSTSATASPPPALTTQIWNVRVCEVKAMYFPSGDQSGSEGLGSPEVLMRTPSPPPAGTLRKARRSPSFEPKQIQAPSGDQQGDDSSWGDLVSRRGAPPP